MFTARLQQLWQTSRLSPEDSSHREIKMADVFLLRLDDIISSGLECNYVLLQGEPFRKDVTELMG
jgi:hypothetical protein